MTSQAAVLNEIMSNAAKAAESAAEAARALRESADRPTKSSFGEASKVVKCPEFFGYTTLDEDQNHWRDLPFHSKLG